MGIHIVLLTLLITTGFAGYVAPIYAEWAHHHVVWINGKQQNQSLLMDMIQNYEKNNIKVGGALIDSAWSTEFNNFEWNRTKFPNPESLVQILHEKDIKVVLWVTSVINNDSSIYEFAKKQSFLLNGGKVIKWWHGHGAFLDYFNPNAVKWWHTLMDKVLNIGIDGFKCDGTDPMTFKLLPWAYSPYSKRPLWGHEYGHRYYGDFYNYTKSKNSNGLIMARPTDSFKTYFSWNYAPREVMFSGWVGDQDSSSEGLEKAMYNILKSAWNGYLSFGFDIGGYRGQNISKNIFLRWVQVGALVPFMENGGNGKHQPWVFDQETVNIYRQFVDLHYKLKPTFLSKASEKYSSKKSFITPLAKKIPQDTIQLPSTYCYLLCDDLLVCPIFEENGQTEVVFPSGSNWIYYFKTKKIFNGGIKGYYSFPLNETALFLKENSVIVMQDEILVVALEEGSEIMKTFVYGSYSDEFYLRFEKQYIEIKVERFFKDPTVSNEEEAFVQVKFVGYKSIVHNGEVLEENQTIKVKTNGESALISKLELFDEVLSSDILTDQ